MARVDEYLERVDNPRLPALTPDNPADAVLLAMLAHVSFADGLVDDAEVAFLSRVLPGRDPDALRQWAITMGSRPFDYRVVAKVLTTEEERWKGLRFAARMAWKDGVLENEERIVLDSLSYALELPPGAVDRVIHPTQSPRRRSGPQVLHPERLTAVHERRRRRKIDDEVACRSAR